MPARGTAPPSCQIVVGRLQALSAAGHQVWLPPLPAALGAGPPARDATGRAAARILVRRAGRCAGACNCRSACIECPDPQEQETLMMDFGGSNGHLALVGAPRSGRSTLCGRSCTAGMLTHTPDEMQFYCIDFGGGTLHAYGAAPHVGSVAGRTDAELVSRTLVEMRTSSPSANACSVPWDRLHRRVPGAPLIRLAPGRDACADVFLLIDNWGRCGRSSTTSTSWWPRSPPAASAPGFTWSSPRALDRHPARPARQHRQPDRAAPQRPQRVGGQPTSRGQGAARRRRTRHRPAWAVLPARAAEGRRQRQRRRACARPRRS